MARVDLRHPANAAGDWFVDERCIDCDTCRQMAPAVFAAAGDQSVVRHQPDDAGDLRDAFRAMVACPTQSIGSVARVRPPRGLFPEVVTPGVYACGFHSEHSFGAWSYFIERPDGNLLVDSPRWTCQLAEPIAERGGLAHVLLTHRDDVADAARYAERFGARVWIHDADRRAAPFATDILHGDQPTVVAAGVTAIPSPAIRGEAWCSSSTSTSASVATRWHGSRDRADLVAFRDVCRYSWSTQLESLARLADVAALRMGAPRPRRPCPPRRGRRRRPVSRALVGREMAGRR